MSSNKEDGEVLLLRAFFKLFPQIFIKLYQVFHADAICSNILVYYEAIIGSKIVDTDKFCRLEYLLLVIKNLWYIRISLFD